MKRIDLYTLLFFVLVLVACGNSNDEPDVTAPTVNVAPDKLSATYDGFTTILSVTSEREWTAFCDDACKEWISCKMSGSTATQGTVEVTIKANANNQSREGNIIVKSGATRISVPVSQEAKPEEPTDPTISVPEGYKLIWQDEFNDASLKTPDESLWKYETGHGTDGWGNNEIQNYIAGSKDGVVCADVSNGTLKIIAQKVGDEVYSVRMNTRTNWKYGYFEARLKLPKGKGTWPAFWMLPDPFISWPDGGEIDIMEEVGYDPNQVLSTIHCGAYNGSNGKQKGNGSYIATAQTEFHVYAVEWTEDYLCFFIDGKEHFRYMNDKTGTATWPFTTSFNLKLNLAWGGNWGGAQGIDESALPATYEIDYVRVFQKK
ncbi:family 16 glycosylhydrolase [uncultured Bacteroides sp.]|uniref:family 16 glycosylhydrolase n=1 Tax=uncultured Bacteroides sp. TaxID=162156 RepID=UPI002586B8E5|nr:family 16 glycosylhydrolase [uncultured Bacteroides sp.]